MDIGLFNMHIFSFSSSSNDTRNSILGKGDKMTRKQTIAVIIVLYLIAFMIFCHSLTGRYQWIPGENNVHGKDYLPRILDTWTGQHKSID